MGHIIVEAIIENGRIKYLSKHLPRKRMKVHLIYDTDEQVISETETGCKLLEQTAGIYGDINADMEAQNLRESWERDVRE